MLLVALLVVLEASGLLIGQMPIKEILRPSIFSGETVDSLECIYQASKDGWDASTFHKLVDYNPPVPSLVLLKTNKGKLAGCFNPLGWQSRDDYRDSLRCYLFRVEGKAVQFSTKLQSGPAVYDFGDRAIWMGEALEIPLNPKYMSRRRARSALSTSYSSLTPAKPGVSGLLDGSEAELSELEVYTSRALLRASKLMTGASGSSPSSQPAARSILQQFEKFLFGGD